MSSSVLLFVARTLLLVFLYLFLYLVIRALRSDLRAATTPSPPAGRGTAAAPALQLEVVGVGQTALVAGQRIALHDPFAIGRASASDLTLDDDWVSAQHLRLRVSRGGWVAEDLGSTNGTRLNGRPLKGAASVKPGDLLEVGRSTFTLVEVP